MVSSVKPWASQKVENFSFSSALGVWVRPGWVKRGLLNGPSLGDHPKGQALVLYQPHPGLGTYCRAWPCGSHDQHPWCPPVHIHHS